VSLCGWRSEALAALGRFEAASASAAEGLRMATVIRHPSSVAIATAFLGYVHLLRGDLPAAVPILERGLAVSEEHGLVHGICANGTYLAWACLLMGQRERGLEYFARGFERQAGAVLQWTRFWTVTAAVHLAADRRDDARRAIAAGLAAVAERGATGYRAPLLRLEADVLLADGDADGARERAEEALALASGLQTPPEIAHTHATLAAIGARLGAASAADTHRATARRMLETLGLGFWAARVG
jgi:tetratricopeptide (TPR) repeat protein